MRTELPPDDANAEAVAEIMRAGHQMSGLLAEIDDLAGMQRGTLSPRIRTELVGPLVRCALARAVAVGDFDSFELDASVDSAVTVEVDRGFLEKSLVKVLRTARRFNPSCSVIHVGAFASGARTTAIAAGPVLEDIRTLSARHAGSASAYRSERAMEGAAIRRARSELAMASHALRAMGGALEVVTGTGGSCMFLVKLPNRRSAGNAPEAAGAGASTIRPAAGARFPVLHIEDNTANRRLVANVLGRLPDVDLYEAGTAAEGVRLAQRCQPGLVMLDVRLPDGCGLELIPDLRARCSEPSVPILVLSASAMPADVERAASSGATEFMSKPINVNGLLKRVRHFQRMQLAP